MNQSIVVFTPAPAPVSDARDRAGSSRSAAARDACSLGELGARFDHVVRGITAEDTVVAASDARRARLLAEAAALSDRMARLDGSAGTATGREWARRKLATEIACATHRSERAVTLLIDDSENLVDHLPATLTALETGRISYRHAQAMVAHARTLPEPARGPFEREVLPHAAALPPHLFADRARRHRETAHPDSLTTRTKAARTERYVAFHPEPDGMATIYHHLPVIDAIAIDDLIDRIARADRTTTATEPTRRTGDTSPTTGTTTTNTSTATATATATEPGMAEAARTHAQRRCDALTDLILGRRDRPRITPTILITAPATTIAGVSDSPGTLHGYGPIDPATTRAIAATAPTFLRALLHPETGTPTTITRHRHRPTAGPVPPQAAGATPTGPISPATTLNTPATITDTETGETGETTIVARAAPTAPSGRDRYTPSPILRTALTMLDETCRFPGCGRRANRCELDHTTAWADGGTTTPDNLAHLCPRHHHLKHEGNWKVTQDRDGTRRLTWTSPRGATYTTTPDPPPP
ncbi:HNH endonuclease signature motif containing protein [Herbiconiux ginsengi]|uniref:HNH endonuclease n=1 Tax=Herbiconiux ginsengi TaxID=381665 RepID=A0A1H3RIE4_9MICO|nr:HNH endonuclease signature motif containing protein [Herbiconiux ginsengi]SDZ24709.1 HNH endonuclease [Herbiconiux ginsengi]